MDLGIFDMIILGMLVFFLFFSFLNGMRRGVIRSFIRLAIVLLCAVVSLFAAQPLASMLLNMDLSAYNISLGDGMVIDGSIQEFIMEMLLETEGLGDILDMAPTLVSLIEQIPVVIVAIVIFVLLFWVLKIVTIIPYCIIKIFIPKRNADGTKKRKHRFCGFLVSILQTVVVMSVFLIPTVGVIDTLEKLAPAIDTMMEVEKEDPESIQAMLSEVTEKSMVYPVLKSTGLKDFYVMCFNKLTNINFGSASASLFDEVVKLMELVSSMNNMMTPEGNMSASGFADMLNKATESEIVMQTLSDIIITNATALSNGESVTFGDTSFSIDDMVGDDEDAREMMQDFFGSFTEENEDQVKAGVVALSTALNAASEYTQTHHGVHGDGESVEDLDSFETVIGDLVTVQDSYLEDIRNGDTPDPDEEALMREVYGAIYDSGVLKDMVPQDIVDSLGLGANN